MIYYPTHIKDVIGNNYIGINIPNGIVDPFISNLKEILGDEFESYIQLQKDRDHGGYHITVINVMDYNRLSKEMGIDKFTNSLEKVLKYEIDDIKMMGVGVAEKNGNKSYFIVCESEKLNAIRERYRLPEFDFHITLGFKWKDVFGVRKNKVLEKKTQFIKLLKNEYYKNDSWNFLKRIDNFTCDKNLEIVPISIDDTFIKVKCGNEYMDISYIDDKFWIVAQYNLSKDLQRLPETEVFKILNKN